MENVIKDKIYGCHFRQAICDALGLGTEFMSKQEVMEHYPTGLIYYSQFYRDAHRSRWKEGDWTDDTDMMPCIANTIIKDKGVNLHTIAPNFVDWKNSPGMMEFGRTTYNVLSNTFKDKLDLIQNTAGEYVTISHSASGFIKQERAPAYWKTFEVHYTSKSLRYFLVGF